MRDDHDLSFAAALPAGSPTGPCLDPGAEVDVRITVLVSRYGTMLRRFLLGLARRPDVADDLVQQLWLKLLEAARSGRFLPSDDAAVRSYLFTAARNLFLDECVRKHASSRTVSHDPQALESLMPCAGEIAYRSADELLEDEQRRVAVAAAIARLSPPQRTVIRLWMSDTSIESMATATGAPRDTVLSRKKYALHSLRATLGAALG